jgi:hypothetical protein
MYRSPGAAENHFRVADLVMLNFATLCGQNLLKRELRVSICRKPFSTTAPSA